MTSSHNNWDPPIRKNQFSKSDRCRFRWQNGSLSVLGSDDPIMRQQWTRRSTASVFPQSAAGQLLIVNIDVTEQDVSESYYGRWTALNFRHIKVEGSKRSYYSYLDFVADQAVTAARVRNHVVPQLLPEIHNSRDHRREHAGLIGKLPLLVAIAALSGATNVRNAIMRACVQPSRWARHLQTACGRGMFN